MNNYEAVFARKSVRKYDMLPLPGDMLKRIETYCMERSSFLGEADPSFRILNYKDHVISKVAPFLIKAPHYLVIYLKPQARSGMSAGFIMQEISLYLLSLGYGSCFMGGFPFKKKYLQMGEKEAMLTLAFGNGKEAITRKPIDIKRKKLDALCVYKEVPRQWMSQLLEAARVAPSSLNSQPWRFVVYDNRIHIFSVKKMSEKFNRLDEANFGIMFANMMTVAEELWLDVDFIRLDNISQKNFPKTEYILSAILKS